MPEHVRKRMEERGHKIPERYKGGEKEG